jgi:tagatose 6-phosphate kinase
MIVCLGTTPALQRTLEFTALKTEGVNRAVAVSESASGKSVNVARVAHALGENVLALGFLGGEKSGFLRADLDRAGVPHDFVETAAATRICTTLLDRTAHTATELVEEPRPVDASAWQALGARLDRALEKASILVLSGSLAPGGTEDFYKDCINRASRRNVPVLLDAARGPLRCALAARPFLAKPNRLELQEATGVEIRSEDSLLEAMRQLVAAGAQWVAVTLGREGLILSDGGAFWQVTSPPIAAVNPIGSGDAVAAGFASGILRRQSMREAARLAVACGAANALTHIAGQLQDADVRRILPQVTLDPIVSS